MNKDLRRTNDQSRYQQALEHRMCMALDKVSLAHDTRRSVVNEQQKLGAIPRVAELPHPNTDRKLLAFKRGQRQCRQRRNYALDGTSLGETTLENAVSARIRVRGKGFLARIGGLSIAIGVHRSPLDGTRYDIVADRRDRRHPAAGHARFANDAMSRSC